MCRLHSEANPDLTLDSARDTALGMEADAKRTKELKGKARNPVYRVQQTPPPPSDKCGRCGRGNHTSSECKYIGAK